MPSITFAHTVKRTAALLVSGTSVLSLLLTFPSEPKILAAQIGVVCTVICSLGLFVFHWTIDGQSAVKMATASLNHKVVVIVGLPISAYAQYSMFHFAFQLPHFWSAEIGMVCGVVCSLIVLIFCWAAPFAYMIHKYDWSPRACFLAGVPFLVLGGVFLIRDWFWNPHFPRLHPYITLTIVLAMPVVATCRKLAFPEIGATDFCGGRRPPTLSSR